MKKEPILIGEYSLYSILSFVFGFFFWPIAFVLGLVALQEMKTNPEIAKGSAFLAWAGMLLQPILIFFGIIAFMIGFAFYGQAMVSLVTTFISSVMVSGL